MYRLIRAVCSSALVLALAAVPALASRGLLVSPNRTVATFPSLEIEGGTGTPVRCDVIVSQTFHSTISKASHSLAGFTYVLVRTGACSEGNAGLLVGGRRVTGEQGPYHMQYVGFTGTLPDIRRLYVLIRLGLMWISVSGIDCLSDGEVVVEAGTTGGNPATGMDITSQPIPLTGDFLCIFSSGEANGSGSLSSSIRMTLF